MERKKIRKKVWMEKDGNNSGNSSRGRILEGGGSTVITPGFIEELNNEGRLIGNKYADFEGTDQECDDIERMYNPYEGL